jgi:hypothetical protein
MVAAFPLKRNPGTAFPARFALDPRAFGIALRTTLADLFEMGLGAGSHFAALPTDDRS